MKELKLQWLLLGTLIDSIAMSLVWPLTTVYMHQELGHTLVMAGFVLFLNSVASIIGSYTAGKMFDRYDSYHLVLGGIIFTGLAFVVLIFSNGWPMYPIMLVIIGLGTGWLVALTSSMGTSIKSKDGRYVFNMLYFIQNLGVMIGTGLVGILFKHSVAPLFLIATIMFIIFFIVAAFTYHIPQNKNKVQQVKAAKVSEDKMPTINKRIVYSFFISLLIMWIFYQQWSSTVSIYMLNMHISLRSYSFLWTVNGLVIVIVQGLLSAGGGKLLPDVYHQVYVGMAFLMSSFAVLAMAHQYYQFVIAMVILTIGEAIAFPSIPAIVNTLSPFEQKGKYQGLASSFPSAGRALGPLIGSMMIEVTSFVFFYWLGMITILIVLVIVILIIESSKKHAKMYD